MLKSWNDEYARWVNWRFLLRLPIVVIDGKDAIPDGHTVAGLAAVGDLPFPLALALVEVVDALIDVCLEEVRLEVVLRLATNQLIHSKSEHLLDRVIGKLNFMWWTGDEDAVLAGLHCHQEGAGSTEAALYAQFKLTYLYELAYGQTEVSALH